MTTQKYFVEGFAHAGAALKTQIVYQKLQSVVLKKLLNNNIKHDQCPQPDMALVGTGAAGVFAPIIIEHWVHAPVLKRVIEFLSAVKVRKNLV